MNESTDTYQINARMFRLVSYVLVSLMMGCMAITVIQLEARLVPHWRTWYLPIACFLISMERLYTHRQMESYTMLGWQWVVAQIAQWVTVAVVLRILVSLSYGLDPFLQMIKGLRGDFFFTFFDNEMLAAFVVVLLVWLITGSISVLLDEMQVDPKELPLEFYREEAKKTPPRERLISTVFGIGAGLVVAAALMRTDIRALVSELNQEPVEALPHLAAGAGNVVVYFFLALALLSQSQFAMLWVKWRSLRIPITRELAVKWALYSLFFLAALAIVVSLLPTSYSMGLLSVLGLILNFFFTLILFIFQLLLWLVMLPISLLLGLLGQENVSRSPPMPLELFNQMPSPEDAGPSTPIPFLEFLKSVLFWVVFLGVIGYSIVYYLRQHGEVLEKLKQIPGFTWLSRIWSWLAGLFGGWKQRYEVAREARQERRRIAREMAVATRRQRFISLRRLSPRQRVYFFFLAMVRRGGEQGLSRTESQTPYEYAGKLGGTLAEVDEDVASLTEAFVEARYSLHEVEAKHANLVKRYWERVRRALRLWGRRIREG
jgi:hypothetical protein